MPLPTSRLLSLLVVFLGLLLPFTAASGVVTPPLPFTLQRSSAAVGPLSVPNSTLIPLATPSSSATNPMASSTVAMDSQLELWAEMLDEGSSCFDLAWQLVLLASASSHDVLASLPLANVTICANKGSHSYPFLRTIAPCPLHNFVLPFPKAALGFSVGIYPAFNASASLLSFNFTWAQNYYSTAVPSSFVNDTNPLCALHRFVLQKIGFLIFFSFSVPFFSCCNSSHFFPIPFFWLFDRYYTSHNNVNNATVVIAASNTSHPAMGVVSLNGCLPDDQGQSVLIEAKTPGVSAKNGVIAWGATNVSKGSISVELQIGTQDPKRDLCSVLIEITVSSTPSEGSDLGLIIGLTVSFVVLAVILAFVGYSLWKRRHHQMGDEDSFGYQSL